MRGEALTKRGRLLILSLTCLASSLAQASLTSDEPVDASCLVNTYEEQEHNGTTYHFFSSQKCSDLCPLQSAEEFLTSGGAADCYVCSSDVPTLSCLPEGQYLRLVAQEPNGRLFDIARLITLEDHPPLPEEIIPKGLHYSPYIPKEAWEEVKPYLIPDKHPVKSFLDKLCGEKRILASTKMLKAAGFQIVFQQAKRGLVVVKHHKIPGYLLKIYLDDCPRAEWPLWVLRAKGARVIQSLLDKHHYNCYMKVPQKYIYPVSALGRPQASETVYPKDFILVVQDMKLVSEKYNFYNYHNGMTFARLDALYKVINEGGLSDSHIGNIPFSVDQKIAFIDTEYVNSWPVHFDWLTKYFSPLNQCYWLKLIKDGEKSGK